MSAAPSNWLEFERFAVYGLGRSGLAACSLLAELGKEVVASDPLPRKELEETLEQLPERVDVIFGENRPAGADAVVLSPGIEPESEPVEDLRRTGLPFLSEIDLAFDAAEADVVAVTGTDGKTTTTAMVGAIVDASNRGARVAGNIGTPLSAVVRETAPGELLVAEISAFQLWSARHFRADAAGFTNLADDHLDYFGDRGAYRRAKRRLIRPSGPEDWGVFNVDDPVVAKWAERFPGPRVAYGPDRPAAGDWAAGCWIAGDTLRWSPPGASTASDLLRADRVPLPGRHNLENAMCAAGLGAACGIGPSAIREGIADFDGPPHRLERVGCADGVTYWDDSKATNVNAAVAGLRALEPPLVVIAGGVDKGLEFGPFARAVVERARGAVLLGESRERLRDELAERAGGDFQIAGVGDLDEAVERAASIAGGEAPAADIVLSPACSSFDMFESYADRGRQYREAARRRVENASE